MELISIVDIVNKCAAMANKNRLIILNELANEEALTLSKLHKKTSRRTGFTHRETTYRYLSKLVKSGLVERLKREEGVFYEIKTVEIKIKLGNIK